MSDLLAQIKKQQIAAMKAKEKTRLATIRLILAAVKQVEVDERKELDDADTLAILTKMVKQRKDSVAQYESAGRTDLADVEKAEIEVIQDFLPQPLSADEIAALIDEAISASGAAGMQDMGKVMGQLKSKIQGRADMGAVSGQVRARLNNG